MIDDLASDLSLMRHDPLRWVKWAFPWGEPGGELADMSGPMPWQAELLALVRDKLMTPHEAIRIARTSGHGIGKSALAAWLVLWAISTAETLGVVTANTERQLKTKTWATLSKWHRLFIARDLFKMTATAIYRDDPEFEREWRVDMIPWSEKNTEAFAGLHNKGKRVLLIFDEGSAIPDDIYEVATGALTDSETEILWFLFGNPTRNTGYFRECFSGGRHSHRWDSAAIDSRSVPIANQKQFAEWVADYGDDSDFVRIRVRGVFPRAGDVQFINSEDVENAMRREAEGYSFDAFVIGLDVARFGDDASVIYFRKGRDGRTYQPEKYRGLDTMQLASRAADAYHRHHADAIFVDGGGVGGGVVDRLRQIGIPVVFDIQFGARPDRTVDGELYANKRAEIWGSMRQWLKTGSIVDDEEIREQLIGPSYGLNNNNAIQLERKEDMKKRGLASPDIADALALTFAYPVEARATAGRFQNAKPPESIWEYDPFAMEDA